eukprot:7175980-Pyramimonas_sp.AAC.1
MVEHVRIDVCSNPMSLRRAHLADIAPAAALIGILRIRYGRDLGGCSLDGRLVVRGALAEPARYVPLIPPIAMESNLVH